MTAETSAIRAANLGKCYHIFARPRDRLKQALFRRRSFYREFWALRDLSFTLPKGDTLGVVGRNGSGKSTLLQLLCGTLTPTHGQVQVAGRIAAILELGAGFHPEFTGRENVQLNARLLGLAPQQIRDRMEAVAAFADIGDFLDQPVKTYSSGMLVRLAFGVMAHVDADVLVIDEALAVGDVFFVQKCVRFLRTFQQQGGTIVLASHDAAAIQSLCSRAIWLDAGSPRRIGSPREVLQDYLAAAHGFAPQPGVPGNAAMPADTPIQPPPAAPSRAPGYGAGGVTLLSVRLLNSRGQETALANGGEPVTLAIKARANRDLFPILVGFFVRDRLGQNLFGDNTYQSYCRQPVRVEAGQIVAACFSFTMPTLPAGDYVVTVGISEGSQEAHRVQHWVHEACVLRSMAPNRVRGLVGVAMNAIELRAQIGQ